MHNSLLYEAADFLLVILFSVGRVDGIDILDIGVDGRPTFFCVTSESLPDAFLLVEVTPFSSVELFLLTLFCWLK